MDDIGLTIKQSGQRTNRPRKKNLLPKPKTQNANKSSTTTAVKPITNTTQQ